jgi:type VI secretion system protein ImpB
MSESKAKVIERNRAPRVQIAYDVEHYGSPTTIELPFVMGVMADLAGASETPEAQKAVPDRSFVETDAGRFPRFMEALSPRVKARVKNTLPQPEGEERDEELAVDLTFASMGDFAPDRSPSRCRSSPSSCGCAASSRSCSASWTAGSTPRSASPSS